MPTSAPAQTSDTGTSGGSGTEGSSGSETGRSETAGDTATGAIAARAGAKGAGEAWPSTVGNTFLTGSDMTTPRSPEKVRSGRCLSADEQARVRADCATFGGGTTGTATGETGRSPGPKRQAEGPVGPWPRGCSPRE